MSKIIIASDHAGFYLKEDMKQFLTESGYLVTDIGTYSPDSVDYPDFAHALAEQIEKGIFEKGILICSSGVGVSITANRHPDVRAALCWNSELAKYSRLHNNSNVLCLPANFIKTEEAREILGTWLNTEFEGGRHQRRVSKIER